MARAVLGVVFRFLSSADLLRLATGSAAMRVEINVPNVLRALSLESAADARRAWKLLAPATWANLHTLSVGDGAASPQLDLALSQVGPSLRELNYCGAAELAELPPAAWATLTTYRHVVRPGRDGQTDSASGAGGALTAETSPSPMPLLEKLEMRCDSPAACSTVAFGYAFAQMLGRVTPSRLRVLSLHIACPCSSLIMALATVAPHLETLAIHEPEPRAAAWSLPALPRAHTLLLSRTEGTALHPRANGAQSDTPFYLARMPALRHLHLRGSATARVAPSWTRDGRGEWRVGALQTFVFESPQSYPGLLVYLEPDCTTLQVLHATVHVVKPSASATFACLAHEGRLHCVGPLLARAASTLRELRLTTDRGADSVDAVESVDTLALEFALHKYPRLHSLRLSPDLLPATHDPEWARPEWAQLATAPSSLCALSASEEARCSE